MFSQHTFTLTLYVVMIYTGNQKRISRLFILPARNGKSCLMTFWIFITYDKSQDKLEITIIEGLKRLIAIYDTKL